MVLAKRIADGFFRDITSLGGIYVYLIIALVIFIVDNYPLFMKLLFGAFASYLIAGIIRIVYFKDRPNKESHSNFIERIDASSFPSIHAFRVSYLLIVFGYAFGDMIAIILIFTAAFLVCVSRIYLRKHDYVDVLGGIVLGIVLGYSGMYLF